MQRIVLNGIACMLAIVLSVPAADQPAKRSARQALHPFNHLIGAWKGTGLPEGTREEKNKGLWIETQRWIWQFKGNDAWLVVNIVEGKHYAGGELRYLADKDQFQLTLTTKAKEKQIFTGKLDKRRLVLERNDAKKREDQRLTISLLHANRFLFGYEVKPADRSLFTKVYRVGATKKGVPFASGDKQPECVVSGGLGTSTVSYKGKTYYVCCSGCRVEFNENPEKYVKEFEAKKERK